jgi:hypothetical protein
MQTDSTATRAHLIRRLLRWALVGLAVLVATTVAAGVWLWNDPARAYRLAMVAGHANAGVVERFVEIDGHRWRVLDTDPPEGASREGAGGADRPANQIADRQQPASPVVVGLQQHSSSEQCGLSYKPFPYGSPGNSQWREEMERAARAKEHAECERRREEDEQHAELLRMQAAGEKERARRVREYEDARAAVIREQEQRQRLSQDVAVKMASGVTIQDDEHFPKTRKEVRLLAYVCTRARTKDTKGEDGKLLLPESDHGDIFEHMLSFFTVDPDFISVDVTYKKLKTLASIGDKIFGAVISSEVDEVVKFLNKKMKENVKALPAKERTMMKLIESAKRKGVLTDLATRLVKPERVARAIATAEESPTLDNIFRAFDETTTKQDGRPLWSLSANIHSNIVSFNNNMTSRMKEKYPESKNAVKVLELARNNNYLNQLARYAANKKAEEDDGDPLDMSDM